MGQTGIPCGKQIAVVIGYTEAGAPIVFLRPQTSYEVVCEKPWRATDELLLDTFTQAQDVLASWGAYGKDQEARWDAAVENRNRLRAEISRRLGRVKRLEKAVRLAGICLEED